MPYLYVFSAGEDPAAECAVSDPIGKEGVVAFPLTCGAGDGLGFSVPGCCSAEVSP